MNARFIIKVGDLEPVLRATLSLTGGAPIDFTGAAAVLVLKPTTGGAVIRKGMTVVSFTANSALVEYAWQAGDTAAAVEWNGEIEVTRANGKPITFPNGYEFKVIVREDLR